MTNYPTIEDTIGNTPLVRLRRLPVGSNTVLLKLEGNNPAGSVKDRAALRMITAAEARGELVSGDKLIEATSGNTGIALAMAAAVRGYKISLIMPANSSAERVNTMRAFGAEVILVDAGMEAARDLALQKQQRGEGKILNQFANADNPLAHFESTGPEIWTATAGAITHFVSAMGTTGTIVGTAKYLKSKNQQLQIIGVQPDDNSNIAGIRKWAPEYLPSIYSDANIDKIINIDAASAERCCRELAAREGIFCGVSTGGALAVALQLCNDLHNALLVCIAPDRGDRYLSTGLFG